MSARKAKRTVTRLQFTEEERSTPEHKKTTQKADKAANKLEKAAKKSKAESLETSRRAFPLVP